MNGDLYEKIEYALGQIAAGDPSGVDQLYECMGKTMLFVAKGVVKDVFLAEDVVQESFVKIVRYIGKYKPGTNGYAWIYRIVRNTALNFLKREKNVGTLNLDEFCHISDGTDTEERTARHVLVEKMMDALSPPVVRQMVYMKYFLDMSVREIAKEVGRSKSYVSKEILKAEAFMKKMLADPWTN